MLKHQPNAAYDRWRFARSSGIVPASYATILNLQILSRTRQNRNILIVRSLFKISQGSSAIDDTKALGKISYFGVGHYEIEKQKVNWFLARVLYFKLEIPRPVPVVQIAEELFFLAFNFYIETKAKIVRRRMVIGDSERMLRVRLLILRSLLFRDGAFFTTYRTNGLFPIWSKMRNIPISATRRSIPEPCKLAT
jgi:hypothetical protein